MKVILIKNVTDLGRAGEIKQVSDGYARNYLLPNNLVRVATERAVGDLETKNKQHNKALENKVKRFKELAKKIDNIKIIVKAKADDKKTLFGSINAGKIAEELKNRNYEIDSKYIMLDQPIKQLGYYDVVINFGSGVTAKVGLTVTREE